MAAAGEHDQQVLIATSMPFGEIDSLGGALDLTLHRFDDRVLTREAG